MPPSLYSTSQSETDDHLSTKSFGRFARISKSKTQRPSTLEFSRRSGANVASPRIAGYHEIAPSTVQGDLEPDGSQSSNLSRRRRGKGPTAIILSSDDDSDPVLSKPNRSGRYISADKERSPISHHSKFKLVGSSQIPGGKDSIVCVSS